MPFSAESAAPAAPEEVVNVRTVAAPRRRILAAFTDPVRLAAWWGPAGFTNTFEVCEPRPGGTWKYVMHGPDGADYENESRFIELGPERIVIDHLRTMHRFRLTICLHEEAGDTRLVWRQRFETAEEADRLRPFVAPANEQNLDRLEAVLRAMGSDSGA